MANALNKVNSGGIEDGSIVNADIKSDAAIAGSKLVAATTSVPGSMSAADKTKLDGVATSATANPSAPALTGSTNNQITTVTGANAIQGEANLTFDGNNLGIGVTSPLYPLHVKGTVSASAPADYGVMMGLSSNDDYAQIQLNGDTGAFIDFSTSGVDQKGRLLYNHSNEQFQFFVNSGHVATLTGANGTLELLDGDFKVASGHGIDFSATSGTGSSELLDDYEEGTGTMQLDGQGGSSPTTQCDSNSCYYTKIGQQVTVRVSWDSKNLAGIGGAIALRNLPFTVANTGGHFIIPVEMTQNIAWSGAEKHCFYTSANTTNAYGLSSRDGNNWVSWASSDWDNSTSISLYLTFTYFTDS